MKFKEAPALFNLADYRDNKCRCPGPMPSKDAAKCLMCDGDDPVIVPKKMLKNLKGGNK